MKGIHGYVTLGILIAAIIHFVIAWIRYIRFYLDHASRKRSGTGEIIPRSKEAMLALRPFLILMIYLGVLSVYYLVFLNK